MIDPLNIALDGLAPGFTAYSMACGGLIPLEEQPTPSPQQPFPPSNTGTFVQTPPQRGAGGGGNTGAYNFNSKLARRTLAVLFLNLLRDADSTEVSNLETSVVIGSVEASVACTSTDTGVNLGQHDATLDSSVDVSELDISVKPGDDTDD